jgi:hypothetical protein
VDKTAGMGKRATSRKAKSASTAKQRVLAAVEKLPADATFENAIERLVFLAKPGDGGKGIDHGEVRRRLLR